MPPTPNTQQPTPNTQHHPQKTHLSPPRGEGLGERLPIFAMLTAFCFVAELILIVGSWVFVAMTPTITDDTGSTGAATWQIQSLLSPEGLRWLVGQFALNLATPVVIDIILLGMSWGVIRKSGVLTSPVKKWKSRNFTERIGLQMAGLVVVVAVVLTGILAFMPHATLISATGDLFPSSFASGLPPIIAVTSFLAACAYGACVSSFKSLTDYFTALCDGVTSVAPVIVLYVFVALLYFSVIYIIGS